MRLAAYPDSDQSSQIRLSSKEVRYRLTRLAQKMDAILFQMTGYCCCCRSLKDPVAAYNHHSHFVWQTRFNPKHEQLLATSSSDSLVTLVNLGERNKARIKPHSRSPSEFSKGSAKKTGPVETFAHDDSVYSKLVDPIWPPGIPIDDCVCLEEHFFHT